MKLILSLSLFVLISASSFAANVVVDYGTLGLERITNALVWMKPAQTNVRSGVLISRTRKEGYTRTDGTYVFTNVVPGLYDLWLQGDPPYVVRIGVTNSGTNEVLASDLIGVPAEGNAAVAYTKSQSDARFIRGVAPGAWIQTLTNNGVVTVGVTDNVITNGVYSLTVSSIDGGFGNDIDVSGGDLIGEWTLNGTNLLSGGSGSVTITNTADLPGVVTGSGSTYGIGTNISSLVPPAALVLSNVNLTVGMTNGAGGIGTNTTALATLAALNTASNLLQLSKLDTNKEVWINVKDFGATGDGGEYTLQLQAALDSVTNTTWTGDSTKGRRKVYIPTGYYKITNTLYLRYDNTAIIGDGVDATRISMQVTNKSAFQTATVAGTYGGAPKLWYPSFENLTIVRPTVYQAGTNSAISFAGNADDSTGASRLYLHKVHATGWWKAVDLNHCVGLVAISCDFYPNNFGFWLSKVDRAVIIDCNVGAGCYTNGFGTNDFGKSYSAGIVVTNNSYARGFSTQIIGGENGLSEYGIMVWSGIVNISGVSSEHNSLADVKVGPSVLANVNIHSANSLPLATTYAVDVSAGNSNTVVSSLVFEGFGQPHVMLRGANDYISYTGSPITVTNAASAISYRMPLLTVSGGVTSGNGQGLTNLNSTNLFGTVPLARLPSAVVTNGMASVTLTNPTFTGNVTMPLRPVTNHIPVQGWYQFQDAGGSANVFGTEIYSRLAVAARASMSLPGPVGYRTNITRLVYATTNNTSPCTVTMNIALNQAGTPFSPPTSSGALNIPGHGLGNATTNIVQVSWTNTTVSAWTQQIQHLTFIHSGSSSTYWLGGVQEWYP